jgi:hypothetical protein
MDQYETSSNQSGEFKDENEQSLHEEHIHPTEENNSDSHHVKPESHIPSLLDLDEQFGEKNGDIPHEDFKLMQEEASPRGKDEDFDFEKKLPDIPSDTLKNDSDTSMKFSPAHFQDEVNQDEIQQPQVEVKKEEYSQGDVEEDEDEVEEEEVLEPQQEVSHLKPQEASPEAVPPKSEEIFTPSQSHRSPSPVLAEEPKHEALSNKSPESLPAEEKLISNVAPISQPETKSRQAEPATLVELATLAEPTIAASAEPLKTRSVKSTKSDGSGHGFLGKYPIHLFF